MTEIKEYGRYAVDECDDIAPMIDAVLGNIGCRIRFEKNEDGDWSSCIGDPEMEEGIREMPEIEQKIIKMFFLQQLTLMDIARDLNLPVDLLMGHIRSMKVRLECHV